MKRIIFLISLPIFFIFMIFILINENHKNKPEKLACSSFKVSLRKIVPLYTSEAMFKRRTNDMCQCFLKENKIPIGKIQIDRCAKDVIYKWIVPSGKFKDTNSEMCFKSKVYNEIIVPFITYEQGATFGKGIFRNEVLKRHKIREANKKYQILLKKCNI